MKTETFISLAANDFSQTSDNYAGKLRSNFFGSKFYIHDSQRPCNSPIQPHGWSRKRISSKKVSPTLSIGNCNVTIIAYELNVLRARGLRRMHSTMHTIPFSSIQEGGAAPTPPTFNRGFDETFGNQNSPFISTTKGKSKETIGNASEPLVLKNKTPRWHEQLQCWCLNFRGRVTVASVKNFQLVASVDQSENVLASEHERVILQFGKIGKNIFTMDYQYPLSAFSSLCYLFKQLWHKASMRVAILR